DRFVSTMFPSAAPAPFVVSLGLVATVAALGSPRSLGRTARLIQPLMLAVLLILFLFSLRSLRAENLLPITAYDLLPAIKGTFPLMDVLALGLFLPGFLLAHTAPAPDDFRRALLWLCGYAVLLTLLAVAVLGVFGPELTLRLTKPFFTLVRNLVFFRSLERMEALVAALWIFPDFLLCSLLLYAGQRCLRLCLGGDADYHGERRRQLQNRRWLIPLWGAAAVSLALVLAPDSVGLARWSERLIPGMNLAVCLLCPLLLYIAPRLRRRKGL
ncbi:MAG: GerAB/ArcD/ProY family transporter, partial [Oscillospiraceae bacterium]|nr:GerAB/ArcD/ProY family transporter [Oscillospiraceae bacterium]